MGTIKITPKSLFEKSDEIGAPIAVSARANGRKLQKDRRSAAYRSNLRRPFLTTTRENGWRETRPNVSVFNWKNTKKRFFVYFGNKIYLNNLSIFGVGDRRPKVKSRVRKNYSFYSYFGEFLNFLGLSNIFLDFYVFFFIFLIF